MYSDLYFNTTMEDVRFDMKMGDRLYSFFLDILSGQKEQVTQNEEEAKGSIWEYWEKEL
ncbi:hypothetical protein [Marinifilum fragile]|uniref:hypothetical protein n=1 Tax=Marinifilum fragile TaxID=570161 RepID=UPI002AA6914C|nr:hypothetical protein [Marinifilum fragile]